jgi:hypothetical protein
MHGARPTRTRRSHLAANNRPCGAKVRSLDLELSAVRCTEATTRVAQRTRRSGLAEDRARGLAEDRARSRQSGANTERRRSVPYLIVGGQTPMCERREHMSVDIWVSTR